MELQIKMSTIADADDTAVCGDTDIDMVCEI